MSKSFSVAILLAVFTTPPLFATVINVPNHYATIQEGINASSDGDTVLVQPDTYSENINFNGRHIVVGSLYLTTGDTTYIETTIIDGDNSGSVVMFESGEDSTAAIIGFTIQNGSSEYGGGILCRESDPTIRRNIITGNHASFTFLNGGGYGGGIYGESSNPIIAQNRICNNTASGGSSSGGAGGGIFCNSNSNPIISDNIITDNSTSGSYSGPGGGIACWNGSHPLISGNHQEQFIQRQRGRDLLRIFRSTNYK